MQDRSGITKHSPSLTSVGTISALFLKDTDQVSRVDHLSRIAHKHALELQSGKKITGGLLLNKTLVAAPMANPAGAKGPEAAKLLRKRKRARLDKNAPVKKKKEATQGTNTAEDQDTEQLAADPSTAE